MLDYVALKAELDAGHPDTGAYSANDQTARDELNAVNRPDTVTIEECINFLLMENVHQTDGTDTQDRAIWTRLKDVEALAVTPTGAVSNPWGSVEIGNITEIRQIKTAQLLDYFTIIASGDLPVDLSDTNFKSYVAGARQAGCMSTAQETALLALGNARQSRASELGFGPEVNIGDIQNARAL